VDGLAEEMPSYLLSEWVAYYQVEPFGEERADVRSAIVAATVANSNRGKDQKVMEIQDFMPKFEAKEPQSVEEMIAFAALLTSGMGGEVAIHG
jgi:hypothetical protein